MVSCAPSLLMNNSLLLQVKSTCPREQLTVVAVTTETTATDQGIRTTTDDLAETPGLLKMATAGFSLLALPQ